MALDEDIRGLLETMQKMETPELNELPPERGREMLRQLFLGMETSQVPVGYIEERDIPGPDGGVPVRIYTPEAPEGGGPHPVLVFFHGGGFVLGDLDAYDPVCRRLCSRSGHIVVSVGYRLAPEHKFPAAVEDCLAATRWAAEHASEIGGDPGRISVAGDSAGGNLAAVISRRARDEGGPDIAGQVLLYPVTYQAGPDTASREENAKGYFLTKADMQWFGENYLRDASDAQSPDSSPANADDLSGLPPALVVTAEYDPLRDEGEDYAESLQDAGVQTRLSRYDGMIHGFINFYGVTDRADRVTDEASGWLREISDVGA